MNKMLFLKSYIVENFNNLIKIMLFFAFLILTIFPYKNVHAIVNGERIVDENTSNYYKNTISNKNLGTLYDDSIWSDKSVYTENNITLDNKFKIENNDDFLTAFSALGSSQVVKKAIAYDVAIIIDVSGSMGQDVVDNLSHLDPKIRIEHSRIQLTINAVNNAIDKLMESNVQNRVTVVVYGATAYTLMELGHYTKIDNSKTYITVEDFTDYNENKYKDSGSSAYTLHAQAIKDGVSIDRSVRNNYGKDISMEKKAKLNSYIGYNTNMQAGIYKGFQELYEKADENVVRFPSALIMSDGGSNYALKRTGDITGNEWYDVPIVDTIENYNGTNYLTFNKKYRTETSQVNRGGKETILDILLTASYMKVKVQKKYEKIFNASPYGKQGNLLTFQIHNVGVDTKDISTQWQVPRIYSTLEPKNYFKSDLPDATWEYKQDSIDAYNLFEQWQSSPDGATSTFTDSDNNIINFKISKLPASSEVSEKEVIENIIYNDSFEDISASDINSWFEDMVVNISSFNPIENIKNSLSYVDPIGEYLELKSFKKAILFGNEYNIIKDKLTEEENAIKQYYKVVGNNNEDLTIINKSNKNLEFKLSDIIIYNQINDNKQEIHINIPSNALPLKVDTIEVDGNNNVTTYVSNVDNALPIRFVYSVGVNDKYMKKNNIKISDISETYIQNNKNSNSLYFYSNTYNKTEYDKKTIGEAYVTFVPSEKNKFYFIQKNYPIFKKSSSGEGILKSSGGNVELTEQLKDLNEIKEDELYYIEHEYFIPTTEDTFKGKLVKYAMEVKGSDFYDSNGNLLVTYYDETKDEETNNKSDNTIVTTKKGICIERIIDKLSVVKTNNLTNTAAYSNVSEFIDGNIKINLGNNGVIIVDSNTGGEILVNPKTGVLRPTIVLIVLGTLAVLLYYKLRKKSSYEI